MALSKDETLAGALAWLFAIREIARTDVGVANLLLDTQPDGISLSSLVNVEEEDDNPSGLTDEEKNLIRQGKHIQAIKEIRHRTSLGLKECKIIADAWRDGEREAGRLPPPVPGISGPWVPPSVAPSTEYSRPPLPDPDQFTDLDADYVISHKSPRNETTPFDADATPFTPG